MSLTNVHFILVRPQMGENIGSVARAIKNFNIKNLRIVNPRCGWPNQKAIATSVGAKDIINQSKKYDTLEQALSKIDIIIATSARFRNKNIKHINLEDLKNASNIGKKAGQRAVARLNARKIKSSTVDVIFEPRIAKSLLSSFSSCISGTSFSNR